ncbi:MAG: hypothetical protein GYA55_12445, partial [SAR324 cluster bacterium]|nr:hypothetical protein [SAR324 cluster bacterium]
MLMNEIVQYALNAASYDTCEGCAGSAFHAITAAMATQGYYMMSQIVSVLAYHGSQSFAVLVYVCAAIGGLVSMALGMPPKLYLWFFMGPAVFHFLLGTEVQVEGVAWQIGDMPQSQSEVWLLAEPGVRDITVSNGNGGLMDLLSGPITLGSIFNWFSGYQFQGEGVTVPWFFAYMDSLISDTTQQLVSWFGFHSGTNQNVVNGSNSSGDYWYLLSSLKWEIMENITSATLSNPDLRDAFVTFLASECGDELKKNIDSGRYASVMNVGGSRESAPDTIFKEASGVGGVLKSLNGQSTVISDSLRRFVKAGEQQTQGFSEGSFLQFMGEGATSTNTGGGGTEAKSLVDQVDGENGVISCMNYLSLIVNGFRWEAGHIYYQLLRSLPKKPESLFNLGGTHFTGAELGATLFDGWQFARGMRTGLLGVQGVDEISPAEKSGDKFYPNLMMNLILVHLFRNEMIAAPRLSNPPGGLSANKQRNYVEMNLKTVGQKSKAGEFYVWAKMLPYLQGVLLYCFAIAYPFVCILILIPGWHKILFTWLSFWLWVKLWDLGFAVVVLLERSVWASFGAGNEAGLKWIPVVKMADISQITINGGDVNRLPSVPTLTSILNYSGAGNGGNTQAVADNAASAIISLFDKVMCAASLDLDLNNAYYIYIMVGLYLAIPAVVGQCVLGAKAGVAGLAMGIIDPVKEAGKAAASGWQGERNAQIRGGQEAMRQAAYAAALRKGGLAAGIINAQNEQAMLGMDSAFAQAKGQGYGHAAQMRGKHLDQQQNAMQGWLQQHKGMAAIAAQEVGANKAKTQMWG